MGADQIWWCENCGYEVAASGSCHACAKPLLLSPISQLTDEEVGYRLEGWDEPERARLVQGLINHGITHRYEGEELGLGKEFSCVTAAGQSVDPSTVGYPPTSRDRLRGP